jgi:hypothetical protein
LLGVGLRSEEGHCPRGSPTGAPRSHVQADRSNIPQLPVIDHLVPKIPEHIVVSWYTND